ncbi:hypothetical protein SERLA73DRAFT_156308 [Serpula lacrymans var. lacrymans S7.3]|uniref:Uncharacterized protein n=1 Tax=Serpula lacrymans var. lacrymans (strain S7.3) TaxID=936435 RepID=F8QDW0_SERL3|nr:hypothetical protein SERLA73DRAFT_156308 [Serpula lacrymans var. lacrymans S7.3]
MPPLTKSLSLQTHTMVQLPLYPNGLLVGKCTVEMVKQVLREMSVTDTMLYAGTSKKNYEVIQAHLSDWMFSTVQCFMRFPILFLAMLQQCKSVVSGLFNLAARRHGFVKDAYEADVDIKEVVKTLNGLKNIDVVVSSTSMSISPIFHFHSTAVMNFISGDGFFSAYPKLTGMYRSLTNANHYTLFDYTTPHTNIMVTTKLGAMEEHWCGYLEVIPALDHIKLCIRLPQLWVVAAPYNQLRRYK